MKVIITESFEKHHKKFFWKEFKTCSLQKIISIVNKEITVHSMYINRPFMKIKFNFCNRAIRMVVSKDEDNNLVIPLFITDKNDKKYWVNLIWETVSDKVLANMTEATSNITHKKYKIF